MKVISIINEKGGVGKTATAINLAYHLGETNKKVMLIDLDPGAFATSAIGANVHSHEGILLEMSTLPPLNSYDIFTGKLHSKRYQNRYGFGVIVATDELAGLDMQLAATVGRETILKRFLNTIRYEMRMALTDLDYIILDCKGSLGILTINAIAASTDVYAIVQAEYSSLEALPKLMKTILTVQEHVTNEPKLTGVLVTMYDSRLKLNTSTVSELKASEYGPLMFKTLVRRNTDIGVAQKCGVPVGVYKPGCFGDQDYKALANEIINGSVT